MRTNSSIKYILLLVGLCAWTTLIAEPKMNKVQSYMWVALAGGKANNLHYGTSIQAKAGVGANLGLGYELQYGAFLFGVGFEGSYQLNRDAMATYLEQYSRTDFENEPVLYGYYHENYLQTDNAFRVNVPIYMGGRFGDYFYATIGASINLPVANSYQVQTNMLTQGIYEWSIEPVRTQGINDFTTYGYYAMSPYTYKASYKDKMSVHARLELGSFIPLEKTKTQLRVGVYASYGIRMGSASTNNLLNLSQVNLDPQTQNEQDLKDHIQWRPLNQSNLYSQLPHNLEVGIKIIVLINVDNTHTPCHCYNY